MRCAESDLEKAVVRLAEQCDREGIHTAHMRSIREVCVKAHGPDEIRGWGFRELGQRWIEAIDSKLVWVVEYQSAVRGVASITFAEDGKSAEIQSLYLTPEMIGCGFGRKLMNLMLNEAKRRGVERICLDSTITAHQFYQSFGFRDVGPARKRPVGGIPVTSFPMELSM